MRIEYGIGKEYLPDWGIQEALREIYQNYLDYGEYQESIGTEEDLAVVMLQSNYDFSDLAILKLGKSIKEENSRGKHGEGLKMAMMVLCRNNCKIVINTPEYLIYPNFVDNGIIGEIFAIELIEAEIAVSGSTTTFVIPMKEFEYFKQHYITPSDIIFSDPYHGDKVRKPAGEIYAGGLYVCTEKNLKGSYNIPPEKLHLDRDRRIPSSFGVSYHASKINEAEAKFSWVDTKYDDYKHIESVPNTLKKEVKVIEVGGQVKFVTSAVNEEGRVVDEVIEHPGIIQSFHRDSYFTKAISKIKAVLIAKIGVKEQLLNFRKKYVTTVEARRDFDLILARMGIRINDSL